MTCSLPILQVIRCLAVLLLGFPPGSRASAAETRDLLGPPSQDGPVIVRADFLLREINAINDEAENFEFTGLLTLEWKDPRQAFDPEEAGVKERVYQGNFQFNELSPGWFPQVVLVNKSGLFETDAIVFRVRPDGTSTLMSSVNAVAETSLGMRRYPFDSQRLEAVFEVLGFEADEVMLEAGKVASDPGLHLSQWQIGGIAASVRERETAGGSTGAGARELVVSIGVARESVFVLRLIALPLMLIVALSWSVFWMDRSSLGDRINLSFVGILTAVAYQILIGDLLPHVSYITLMHAFLNISFLIMCASAVMNLVVGSCDKAGKIARGDLIDRRCRWIFPLVYAALLAVAAAVMFFAEPSAGNFSHSPT